MSVPLDCLYHYIENIAKEINSDIVIYRFYPHGSKKLENLKELTEYSWQNLSLTTSVYCNDQEPLDYELYQNIMPDNPLTDILKSLSLQQYNNLKIKATMYDKVCLIHSEQRSENIEKYPPAIKSLFLEVEEKKKIFPKKFKPFSVTSKTF